MPYTCHGAAFQRRLRLLPLLICHTLYADSARYCFDMLGFCYAMLRCRQPAAFADAFHDIFRHAAIDVLLLLLPPPMPLFRHIPRYAVDAVGIYFCHAAIILLSPIIYYAAFVACCLRLYFYDRYATAAVITSRDALITISLFRRHYATLCRHTPLRLSLLAGCRYIRFAVDDTIIYHTATTDKEEYCCLRYMRREAALLR